MPTNNNPQGITNTPSLPLPTRHPRFSLTLKKTEKHPLHDSTEDKDFSVVKLSVMLLRGGCECVILVIVKQTQITGTC